MLKQTIRFYAIFGLAIYLITFINIDRLSIQVMNFIVFLLYLLLLNFNLSKNKTFYSKSNLSIIIFSFSIFVVGYYNIISFIYNSNFYQFSESDAVLYYRESVAMANLSFFSGINYFLNHWPLDDLGAVLFISTIFRLGESILLVNFFYILVGILSARRIYSIGLNVMSNKYAFYAALTYSASSYVMFYHSSLLKESVMVFILVSFYDVMLKYVKQKKTKDLFFSILFAISFLLYRPAILVFILVAIFFSFLIQKNKGLKGGIAIIILMFIAIIFMGEIEKTYNRYTNGGNIEMVIENKEAIGSIKGSVTFSYITTVIAQMMGPFPTFSPDRSEKLSFFSSGLFFRVLLFAPFWFGIYYIFKLKVIVLYPLSLFVLFEMTSLSIILEGLELRKSMPQIPLIYLISFWFLYQIDITKNIKNKTFYNKVIPLSLFFAFAFVVLYNLR